MLKKVLVVAAGCFALGCTSAQAEDLALNRPATASSTEGGRSEFQPINANDGNSSTRWSSEFADNQWWQVDLGSNQPINRVELNWEVAYARRYRIRTRTTTGDSWSTAATVSISSAGLKTHTFATRRARYVRIQGDVRATPWGISLWDLRVCNISCSGPAPPRPPDADGDGVPDPSDQCANQAGPASNNGCPVPPPPNDTDGDGVPDSQDQCPNQPGPASNNGCPAPPPTGEPGPIAGQGYSRVLADEFDTLNRAVWDNRMWWGAVPPADSQYVQDGVLHLVSRRSQGYPDVNMTTQTSGLRYRQGYFEARMRWTKGNGSWPAFWLLSYAHATNPNWPNPPCPNTDCLSAELDIFEGQGREPNVFYGTIHRNSCDCYGVASQQNGNNRQPVGMDLTAGFHVYAAKWNAQSVTWYLDGVQLHSVPVYDSFNQSMFVVLTMQTGGWTGGTDSSTPNELHTEVDWVRVWQQ